MTFLNSIFFIGIVKLLFFLLLLCQQNPRGYIIRTASSRGAFFYMPPILFHKSATTPAEQIVQLQQRGLTLNDISSATHYLTFIGYYRLSGYWRIFESNNVTHTFIPGTTFEDIIKIYDFDRELRLLVYDAIERIEIAFRAVLINTMCAYHPCDWFALEDLAHDMSLFEDNIGTIDQELDRSKEEFVRHHYRTYGKSTFPPAWKSLQVLSFGTLSKLYSNLKNSIPEKKTISAALGLPNPQYVIAWITSMNILRNYCAHHSRIVYRTYEFPPKALHHSVYPWIPVQPPSNDQLYSQLLSIKFLLNRVSPGNCMKQRIQTIIAKYPGVSLVNAGFPANWEQAPVWQ